jgi:hypothetical protein
VRRFKASEVDGKGRSVIWPNARLVILCGLILGFAEPRVIFGSFNANVIFWTSVWLVLSRPTLSDLPAMNAKAAMRGIS